MRRSTAIENIFNLILDEVITLGELEEFTDELKEAISFMVERWQ